MAEGLKATTSFLHHPNPDPWVHDSKEQWRSCPQYLARLLAVIPQRTNQAFSLWYSLSFLLPTFYELCFWSTQKNIGRSGFTSFPPSPGKPFLTAGRDCPRLWRPSRDGNLPMALDAPEIFLRVLHLLFNLIHKDGCLKTILNTVLLICLQNQSLKVKEYMSWIYSLSEKNG